MNGPERSEQRKRFERDLPLIEERIRRELVGYQDLAVEYGLSVPGIRKAIKASGFGERFELARKSYRRRVAAERRAESRRKEREQAQQRELRLNKLREAFDQGRTMTEVAGELDIDLGNLSRLAKKAGLKVPIRRKKDK